LTLERAAPWSPIWPCSRWGFPCLLDYSRSGGLLPRLFTLAANTQLAAVYSLWHCPSKSLSAFLPRVSHPNKHELRGIAPSGVRTFLPGFAPEAILRPSKINLNLPAYLRDDKFRHRPRASIGAANAAMRANSYDGAAILRSAVLTRSCAESLRQNVLPGGGRPGVVAGGAAELGGGKN